LPNLGIFRKSKKDDEIEMEENESTAADQTTPTEQEPIGAEGKEVNEKTYLRAMPLRELSDLEAIKSEVSNGNIIILKVTPLANKSIQDVSVAVNDLYAFVEKMGGDIARLGEERVVICPPKIRIWREKTSSQSEPLPTAA
jgi:SepF-like predicted cell division protein (DUF552 family)